MSDRVHHVPDNLTRANGREGTRSLGAVQCAEVQLRVTTLSVQARTNGRYCTQPPVAHMATVISKRSRQQLG